MLSIVRDLFYWCAYLWALRNLQIKDASEISQVTFHSSGFKLIQKTWPVLCCRLEISGLCSDLCSSWIYFFPSVLLGSTVNHMRLSTPCILLFRLLRLCSETLPAHSQWLSVQLAVHLTVLRPPFLLSPSLFPTSLENCSTATLAVNLRLIIPLPSCVCSLCVSAGSLCVFVVVKMTQT